MQGKKCRCCSKIKSINDFAKNRSRKDGRMYICKSCESIRSYKKTKTKSGLIRKIHEAQRGCSKRRNHNPPAYTFEELKDWIYSQPNWNKLYKNWVDSGYDSFLRPSIDRLEDNKGYSFSNIRLVTWKDNLDKSTEDQRNGILNIKVIPVVQLALSGEFVKEFFSIAEAGRQTGFDDSSISKACKGKLKTVKGYKWKYKEDYEIRI